jgi:hypothetical protein
MFVQGHRASVDDIRMLSQNRFAEPQGHILSFLTEH